MTQVLPDKKISKFSSKKQLLMILLVIAFLLAFILPIALTQNDNDGSNTKYSKFLVKKGNIFQNEKGSIRFNNVYIAETLSVSGDTFSGRFLVYEGIFDLVDFDINLKAIQAYVEYPARTLPTNSSGQYNILLNKSLSQKMSEAELHIDSPKGISKGIVFLVFDIDDVILQVIADKKQMYIETNYERTEDIFVYLHSIKYSYYTKTFFTFSLFDIIYDNINLNA